MFDLIIRNARIYDGSGQNAYTGDLAVLDGKIAAVGVVEGTAKQTVDAQGLALAPGFIDSHSHSDNSILWNPGRLHVLRQGVTTEVAGQCGVTLSPVPAGTPLEICRSLVGSSEYGGNFFPTMEEELNAVRRMELGPNQVYFAGHAPIRYSAMGLENRRANEEDIKKMQALLEACMKEGALGFSTGLSYVPGIYGDTRELVEVAKTAARCGGTYITHSRSESAGLFKSVQECIDIAREANIPVQISHMKIVGKTFWPRCGEMLAMIDEANRQGLKVTMDAYPYIAVSTSTTSAIPARFLDQGKEAFGEMLKNPAVVEEIRREIYEIDDPGWDNSAFHVGLENFLIAGADHTPEYVGKTYAQVAEEWGMEPFDAMVKLLIANKGQIRDIRFAMCEENLEAILSHPLCTVGSDGTYVEGRDKLSHPRAFGTFPRFLGRYVRERQIMSREEGVRRITGMPAERFGLQGKGFLRPGYDADLVLFDYDRIIDRADFQDPFQPNEGIHRVYMKGQLVLQDNCETGIRNGEYLMPKRNEG